MKTTQKPLLTRTQLIILLWLLIFMTFPKGVFCGLRDIVDEISFVTLLVVFFMFLCAIIGFYARRVNGAMGGAGPVKSSSIFR